MFYTEFLLLFRFAEADRRAGGAAVDGWFPAGQEAEGCRGEGRGWSGAFMGVSRGFHSLPGEGQSLARWAGLESADSGNSGRLRRMELL